MDVYSLFSVCVCVCAWQQKIHANTHTNTWPIDGYNSSSSHDYYDFCNVVQIYSPYARCTQQ